MMDNVEGACELAQSQSGYEARKLYVRCRRKSSGNPGALDECSMLAGRRVDLTRDMVHR